MNYNLGFIKNSDFHDHVRETVEKYRFQIDLTQFNKNLIDPIKLTFDSKVYQKTVEETIESEIIRQMDKSNTNHIGYFHQNIFNYIGEGWIVPSRGYDIVNESKQYYVEMKNKHNTMNSSSSQKTYMRMQNTILKNPQANCFLVEVIARNRQNTPWLVSLDGVRASDDRIRRISIDKFYELVTGDKLAFKRLCDTLPQAIENIVSETLLDDQSNTVIDELKEFSPQLLKSLYLLSFGKYEGFNQL